jgi:outer membrane biosynthesis protein TonB
MPGKPSRAALEPLAPAIWGIGLALLLLGLLAWTLLPVFAPDDADGGSSFNEEGLVWRKPSEFIEVPQEKPEPEPPQKPAAELKKAPPASAPVAVASPRQEPAPLAKKVMTEPSPAGPKSVAPSPTPASAMGDGLEYSISSASGMDALLPRRATGGLSTQIGGGLSAKGAGTGRREPVQTQAAATSPGEVTRPLREPAKYIAISAMTKTASQPLASVPQPVPSLLQIAVHNEADRILAAETGGADMGPVEKVLQRAMLEAWRPPSPALVPADQRRVEVRLAVLRDGAVRDAIVHKKSGSQALDESVEKMLKKVVKISESLPVKFPGTRYSLQVNLQID